MRIIQTFILRLLIDTEEPGRLRGSLRSILNDSEYPFGEGRELLTLLGELSQCSDEQFDGTFFSPNPPETDQGL